jgi:SAM-dependent MidA family methyltransferase
MTRAGTLLAEEISRLGPVPFHRFMDAALYHPEFGYYRRAVDPFGRNGDYYTAELIQPVFGVLIAARIRQFRSQLGSPDDFVVVELGAGRGNMSPAFAGFRYFPVDVPGGEWPRRFSGVVFSNEFFDALPVDVVTRRGREFRQMLVGFDGERFQWIEGPPAEAEQANYLDRYAKDVAEGAWVEVNLEALRWIDEISARLERGFVLTIDYGYTACELASFPQGTLMSYRRHVALESVLAHPGESDITAHVCFSALQDRGHIHGLESLSLENLSRTLREAGEPDQFASALASNSMAEEFKRRQQLKTLLFVMGERFRALIQGKTGGQ